MKKTMKTIAGALIPVTLIYLFACSPGNHLQEETLSIQAPFKEHDIAYQEFEIDLSKENFWLL